jgi:Universal stress protein family
VVKKKTAGKIPVNIKLQAGDFNQELQLVCEDMNPFLVVMGNLGKSALERFFLGSHTIDAMRHLTHPLITVPPQAQFSAVRKIALAYDFEQDIGTFSFDTIRSIVKAFHAEFHIINIGKKNEFIKAPVFDSGILEERMKELKPNYQFITGQDSDAGILDFIEKYQMDLLIVIPGIHGLWEKLNHRSHSKQFLLHSHIPILSIRNVGSGQ